MFFSLCHTAYKHDQGRLTIKDGLLFFSLPFQKVWMTLSLSLATFC